jgi:hypothetical protein
MYRLPVADADASPETMRLRRAAARAPLVLPPTLAHVVTRELHSAEELAWIPGAASRAAAVAAEIEALPLLDR